MTGKEKCRVLKNIRYEIAKANGISFETTECKYQGECMGFCPKCDSEVRYLERELQRKAREGEAIQLTGLAYPSFLDSIESDKRELADNRVCESREERIVRLRNEGWEVKGEKVLEMTIEELDLSARAYSCLKRAGIYTVDDLTSRTEEDMIKVRNLGRKALEEVIQKLASLGLSFKESDDDLMVEGELEPKQLYLVMGEAEDVKFRPDLTDNNDFDYDVETAGIIPLERKDGNK